MSFVEGISVAGDKRDKLSELQDLVSGETKLHINNDEKILLRFLYYSDFDVSKAFEKMKSWYKLKSLNSDWFATQVMTDRQKLAMSRDVHCLLKDRDHLGRRVYILKLGNVVIGECEPYENFQVDDLWLELAMDEEETQKNGLVYIFDMKGLSFKYLRYFTPSNCKVSSTKAENIPIRKMEYHVVNSGFLLNSMVTIVFPFLSGSTKENIHFHKSNWPSLHKFVSPNILPEEYGGKLPPLDYKKLRTYITDRQARLEDFSVPSGNDVKWHHRRKDSFSGQLQATSSRSMALVRVKRRAQDDPIDVLLLACKKFKTAEDTPVAKVFKFAATVTEEEKDVKAHLNQAAGAPKVPLKYRQNEVTSITEKLRAENKLFSQNNRLKVVNCFRALDSQLAGGAPEEAEDEGKPLTVVDIESEPSSTREAPKGSSNSETPPTTEEQYVYDLYYSQVGDFDDLLMENLLSAHEVDQKLFFGDMAGNDSDDSNVYEDEDDSNDENNWRNDYPDEEEADDESSLDEEDMRLAMGMANVNINGEHESDLSSDREDEALIYGDDERRGYYFHTTSDSDSDFYN